MRLCGSAPPPPVPGTTLPLYCSFLSLSVLKLPATPAKGYCKSLLSEPKTTKDMKVVFPFFPPLCLSQKQQECCHGNFKSFHQNRPVHCQEGTTFQKVMKRNHFTLSLPRPETQNSAKAALLFTYCHIYQNHSAFCVSSPEHGQC